MVPTWYKSPLLFLMGTYSGLVSGRSKGSRTHHNWPLSLALLSVVWASISFTTYGSRFKVSLTWKMYSRSNGFRLRSPEGSWGKMCSGLVVFPLQLQPVSCLIIVWSHEIQCGLMAFQSHSLGFAEVVRACFFHLPPQLAEPCVVGSQMLWHAPWTCPLTG